MAGEIPGTGEKRKRPVPPLNVIATVRELGALDRLLVPIRTSDVDRETGRASIVLRAGSIVTGSELAHKNDTWCVEVSTQTGEDTTSFYTPVDSLRALNIIEINKQHRRERWEEMRTAIRGFLGVVKRAAHR